VDELRFLFYIQGYQRIFTVFDIATRLAERGEEIVFMFTQKGVRHLDDRDLMKKLSYALGLNCLESETSGFDIKGEVVKLNYQGLVKLIEECPQIISWT
jgi:hypothetical protein